MPRYIVAEVKDDTLTLGWTFEVFTDPAEALGELADAHEAGLTGRRIYRLEPCRTLAVLPAGSAR